MQFSDGPERSQVVREGILERTRPSSELDYEEVLAKIGFGRTQWSLLLISGLLTITSMASQLSVGIIAIASQCDFHMTQSEKGVMMAACVAGIFLSTYFWGYVSDALGRRTVLLYGMFATNLLQFLTMFVTNIWLYNCLNLLMGISLGGVTAAIYAYLSEFTSDQYRAVVINYSTMFVSVASIYVPATAWLVLSADWSLPVVEGFVFRPWRLIILLNLLPGLVGALMLLPFPESPKLLLAQESTSQAVAALSWVCRFNTGLSLQTRLNIDDLQLKPEVVAEDNVWTGNGGCGVLLSIWRATVPLFHRPHRMNFLISVTAMFGMFFASSGMQIWYPEIVNRTAVEPVAGQGSTVCEILDDSFARQRRTNSEMNSTQETVCDDRISTKTHVDNMIVGAAFLVGFSLQGALLNPLGRKNVLMGSLAIGALSGILLHFVTNSTAVLVSFCLYILLPGLSISVMCGAVVDLVPTHLRGKAVSMCFTLGRLGIIVATNFIALLLEPLCNGVFATFTCSMAVCALLVYFLPFK